MTTASPASSLLPLAREELAKPGTPPPWAQRFLEFHHPGVFKVLHYDPHVIEDLAQHLGIRNLVVAGHTSLGQNPQGQHPACGDQPHEAGYASRRTAALLNT